LAIEPAGDLVEIKPGVMISFVENAPKARLVADVFGRLHGGLVGKCEAVAIGGGFTEPVERALAITAEGLAYATGMREKILHGTDH